MGNSARTGWARSARDSQQTPRGLGLTLTASEGTDPANTQLSRFCPLEPRRGVLALEPPQWRFVTAALASWTPVLNTA